MSQPDIALVDACFREFNLEKCWPYLSIFGESNGISILDQGLAITAGQFGLPTFPKLFASSLISLTPRWDQKTYGKFYRDHYAQLYNLEDKADVGIAGIHSNYKSIAGWLGESIELDSLTGVLEIGSGPGIGLSHFLQITSPYARGYCCESSLVSKEKIKSLPQVTHVADYLSDLSIGEKKLIDLVILRHVVEHMANPISELLHLKAYIAPMTPVYIAVPDMLNPRTALRDYDHWVEYWFRVPHIHYFNKYTLTMVLAKAGFVVDVLEELDNEIRVLCHTEDHPVQYEIPTGAFQEQLDVVENLLGDQRVC